MPTAAFRQGFSLRSSARTPDQLPGENGLPARHDLFEDARLIGLLCRVRRHAGGEHDRQSGGQNVGLTPREFWRQVSRELLPVFVGQLSDALQLLHRRRHPICHRSLPFTDARFPPGDHVPMNAFATSRVHQLDEHDLPQPRTFERQKRKLNAVIPVYSARGRCMLWPRSRREAPRRLPTAGFPRISRDADRASPVLRPPPLLTPASQLPVMTCLRGWSVRPSRPVMR